VEPTARQLLTNVDSSLASAVELMKWWQRADADGTIKDRFELTKVFNRPDSGYSFFDKAPLSTGPLPVMGDVPRMFYDQPKGREFERWCQEVRRYALRYFMRVSDFRLPETVVDENTPKPPPPLGALSWCPRGFVRREGFGFEQLYYKERATGKIGRFPDADRYAIIDVRRLFDEFEWVVASVRIFDFDLSYPLNPDLPRFTVPLKQTAWVVLSADFVIDDPCPPEPELCGRYQFGYAMLRLADDDSILAFGPGQFDAGFQLFDFQVLRDGTVRVSMPFVVNRPEKILNLSLDPLDWAFFGAEVFSLGLAKPFLEPFKRVADSLPFRPGGFDPVFTGIDLLNLVTLNQASKQLCISKNQLEKMFLIFHFNQYYTMITGSLLTWRQIPDWLAPEELLPPFVVTGRSS
jgi:hypothetical protein